MRTASILLALAGLAAGQPDSLARAAVYAEFGNEVLSTKQSTRVSISTNMPAEIGTNSIPCRRINPAGKCTAKWRMRTRAICGAFLDDAAKTGAGRSPNQQKIGDFFAACMNEPAIEKAGDTPLTAGLAQIAALKSLRAVAAYVASEHRAGVNDNVLFNVDAEPDLDDSAQMMANLNAGGLGLPDRDYYTKTDAKSVEIRARYLQHVAQILQLTGETTQHGASRRRYRNGH